MDPPDWLDSYSDFLSELKSNFGPHNPKAKAKAKLENLRMCDNQRITKYTVEFNRLAVCVHWGSAALQRQYYNGLPARIKDAFMITGRPNSLLDLKNHSHLIDGQYWERRSEQVHEDRAYDCSRANPRTPVVTPVIIPATLTPETVIPQTTRATRRSPLTIPVDPVPWLLW